MRSITCKHCGGEFDRDDLVASVDDPYAMRCPDCDNVIFRAKRRTFAGCGSHYSGDEYRAEQNYGANLYQTATDFDCE